MTKKDVKWLLFITDRIHPAGRINLSRHGCQLRRETQCSTRPIGWPGKQPPPWFRSILLISLFSFHFNSRCLIIFIIIFVVLFCLSFKSNCSRFSKNEIHSVPCRSSSSPALKIWPRTWPATTPQKLEWGSVLRPTWLFPVPTGPPLDAQPSITRSWSTLVVKLMVILIKFILKLQTNLIYLIFFFRKCNKVILLILIFSEKLFTFIDLLIDSAFCCLSMLHFLRNDKLRPQENTRKMMNKLGWHESSSICAFHLSTD